MSLLRLPDRHPLVMLWLSGNKGMANGGSSPISFNNHIRVEILRIRVSGISMRYGN